MFEDAEKEDSDGDVAKYWECGGNVAKVGVALTGNTLAVAVTRPGAGALPRLVAR